MSFLMVCYCSRLSLLFFFFKQKTAYDMRISDWSSDVCSSDPVEIDATLAGGHLALTLVFSVEYSSTCPASAALSRQLNAERFAADFAAARPLSTGVVHDWLASERGLAATPPAQRSSADEIGRAHV